MVSWPWQKEAYHSIKVVKKNLPAGEKELDLRFGPISRASIRESLRYNGEILHKKSCKFNEESKEKIQKFRTYHTHKLTRVKLYKYDKEGPGDSVVEP